MAESSNDVSRMTPPPPTKPQMAEPSNDVSRMTPPPQTNPKWLSQGMM